MAIVEDHCSLRDIIERLGSSISDGGCPAKYFKYPRALYYYLRKMDSMVGMGSVKSLICKMVQKHITVGHDGVPKNDDDDGMNHILILGPPGSGKSTISKLLCQVICAIGFLEPLTSKAMNELEHGINGNQSNSNSTGFLSQYGSIQNRDSTAETTLIKDTLSKANSKNQALTKRLINVNSLSRELHDNAAQLSVIVTDIKRHVSSSNVTQSDIPRLADINGYVAMSDQGMQKNISVACDMLSDVKIKADRLLIVSHISDNVTLEVDTATTVTTDETKKCPNNSPVTTDEIIPEADFDPRYVEASRSDMVGKFVGHTASKVRSMATKAMGGVLFIDEAYALVNRINDEPESFSSECINTLCGLMSKYAKNFVVSMAGYQNETLKAISINSGMERRFVHVIKMDSYTNGEMEMIFRQQLSRVNLTPRSDVDLGNFIKKHSNIIGDTGSVTSQLSTICMGIYSTRRCRQIFDGTAASQIPGQIDIEILELGLERVKSNIQLTKPSDHDNAIIQHMYS